MKNNLFPMVILAGGLATRLRPLTETIPKALVPINQEPFIAHQLRLIEKQGIKEVVLCLGYLGEQVIDYVGHGQQFNLNVTYSFDGEKLLGTAGAIKRALPKLSDVFFVMNGDSYLSCDYFSIQNTFLKMNTAALMTVFQNQGQWDNSNVEFSDGRIIAYDKQNRTPQMQYIDYGLSIFKKSCFNDVPENEIFDLVPVYQTLLKNNQLAAHLVTNRFYENGSHAGIAELELYLNQ